MFESTRKSAVRIGTVTLALLVFGCNLDGLRIHRQPPKTLLARGWSVPDTDPTRVGLDIATIERGEVDLIESVVEHRRAYHAHLRELRDYYHVQGYEAKRSWAQFELDALERVQPFRYLMDAEVPDASLIARDSIPEADEHYVLALGLMREAGHGIRVVYRRDGMIAAARAFRELILKYPTSDKIDDAAFHLGELHKSYLPGQEDIAVKWYERAWRWNSQTPHPARFEAAVVYDYRLHDRDRALELYQQVIMNPDPDPDAGNLRFAQRRIDELAANDQGKDSATP